jgi:hypothetical protein
MPDLPEHPRRRPSRDAPDRNDLTGLGLDDRLNAGVAQEAIHRCGMDDAVALQLGSPAPVGGGVHHHRRAIGVGVAGEPGRADRHERIGAPSVTVDVVLAGHRRDDLGRSLQRLRDERALRGRQLSLEAESAALIEVPPLQPAIAIDLRGLFPRSLRLEVGTSTHRAARDLLRPRDQSSLRLRRGESRQLDDLVDAERPVGQRPGQPRQGIERMRRDDPSPGLPFGDAVAHPQPMSDVTRTIVLPRAAPVDVGGQPEELKLGNPNSRVGGVGASDEVLEHGFDTTTRH